MQNKFPMLEVEDAVTCFLDYFQPLEPEPVPILSALDMVLAENITAEHNIPPEANSAMDGFAVHCDDTRGARSDLPRRLRTTASLMAGDILEYPFEYGTAIRIMTGAPIPPDTEAVIPVEEVQIENEDILVFRRYPHGANIRHSGEDVKAGQTVLSVGTILHPAAIGMLSALGRSLVMVHRRPRVALLSTGNELIDANTPWKPGKIHDANRYSNAAQTLKYGGIPIQLGIARDNLDDIKNKIRTGIQSGADLFLTSGGVSMGDLDLVKKFLSSEGEIVFWKVRMKPGRPVAFGIVQGIPMLGLPGNPVSAMVAFEIFARPAILKMLGKKNLAMTTIEAILANEIHHKDNRRHYVRVTVHQENGATIAKLTGDQGSGILYSMVKADGLAIIPEDVDHLPAGSLVKIMMLD